MNIDQFLRQSLNTALVELYHIKQPPDTLVLQPTRKEFEGTHTFVTFPYAKKAGKSPQELGESLGQYLEQHFPEVKSYQVVKGFLNITFQDRVWLDKFRLICDSEHWGKEASNGKTAVVEISSPNTNKPLHLGHMRNIFLGFSTSNILEAAGFQVKKVCIVNDRGIHICKSMVAYKNFGEGSTPESTQTKGDHFVGRYYVKFDQVYKEQIGDLIAQGLEKDQAKLQAPILKEAQSLLKKWEDQDPDTIALWEQMNQWVYSGFDQTYQTMEVGFDKVYYESNTYVLGKDIVNVGLETGVFLKKEDQSVWVDLTDEGLDEKLILRGDGTSVYMTQDLGTADLRFEDFNFDTSIYVVGNEQDYHFKVLFKILERLGRPYAKGLYHLSYGMVDLPSGKMKSREGTVVDADQIMEEMIDTAEKHTLELGKIEGLSEQEAQALYKTLGLGALKYFLTKVDPKKRMMFNPEESIAFQGDTGPFIQYTYARISAILRKGQALALDSIDPVLPKSLHPSEGSLIHLLNEYPHKITTAAKEYAPSVIAQYVYELAKEYNRFYAEVSIFNESSDDLKSFRVQLSKQVARTINMAMSLLGINVPERM